jgi:GNAT superfamily N-acetyltransferase
LLQGLSSLAKGVENDHAFEHLTRVLGSHQARLSKPLRGESFTQRKQSAYNITDRLDDVIEAYSERNRRAGRQAKPRDTLRVREARNADVAAMVELLGYLFKQERDFSPAAAKQRRALEILLAQPAMGRLFVLTRGSKILGMVSLLFTISTAEGGKAAWLEDLVVRPEHRGKGLGTRLLRAAIDWARREGLTRITLLTDTDNANARQLYARHGFTASAMQPLRLHLARTAPPRALAMSLA